MAMEIPRTTPFFSIVIPTYNRGSHIRKCVNSVLSQYFKDYEIIVVDDGSIDETKELVTQMAISNPSIRYFFKRNEERSIARNFGIMQAVGKYVGFLDSDDIAYPNHLDVAYKMLASNSYPEIGHLGYEVIDSTGRCLLKRNDFDNSFKKKLIYENIIHGNAIFIRRDIALEVNFIPSPDAILSEDWYLWLRLAARFKFHFENTITTAVLHHDQRSLLNIDPDKLIASTNIIVEYLKRDTPFQAAYKGKVSYHFANHYTFLTLVLALSKRRRADTVRYLIKAITYDPSVIFRRRFLASVKHFL